MSDMNKDIAQLSDDYGKGVLELGSGGGGDVLVIGLTTSGTTMTLDKTWQEIYDHMSEGRIAMVLVKIIEENDVSVTNTIILNCEGVPSDSEYYVNFVDSTFSQFIATSPSGYPVAQMGNSGN